MPMEWNDVNFWHWVSQVVFSNWIFRLKFCLQFLLLPSMLCAALISSPTVWSILIIYEEYKLWSFYHASFLILLLPSLS
jgi:hypothetical protein